MSPGPNASDSRSAADSGADSDDTARILLFMRPGRDRDLLADAFRDRYEVETTTDVATLETTFDCCVFDTHEFERVAGTVQSRRDTSNPAFLPFVLLTSERAPDSTAEAWEYVDDIIQLPVKRAALRARIGNLVERRRTAVELAERERQLARTVEDLKLKERAMDEAPVGITIAERDGDDTPTVYANERFSELTGYTNMVGDDCRILQGEETSEATRAAIREAIDEERPISTDILNYRKNGRKFWNRLTVAPIPNGGDKMNFVGFQMDITERKIRERRLDVLNRVLSHNLRNKMNVIEGYAALIRQEHDDPPDGLCEIERAATDLMGLAGAVRTVEHTMSASGSAADTARLDERLPALLALFDDRYPDAEFDLTLPDDDAVEADAPGLITAIEEAIENAVAHNDRPHPAVHVTVARRPGWIDVDIEDNGPGIPDQELRVLGEGETSLSHADRLGIWLIYWVVNRAGGDFSVPMSGPEGSVLRLSVPSARQGDQN